MESTLNILKGTHPGLYLARELNKRKLNQRKLALEINEHPQTLNAVIKQKRSITTALALKLENQLGLSEGFLAILQTYHDIEQLKSKSNAKPDLSKFSKSTFWDTDIPKIDWQKMKASVIERVMSYGTEEEKEEIRRFYGESDIQFDLK